MFDDGDTVDMGDEKIGKKKLAKLQAKEEKRVMREAVTVWIFIFLRCFEPYLKKFYTVI